MATKIHIFVCALLLAAALCRGANSAEPLYPNSVASNNLDFILTSDPNAFQLLSYLSFQQKEMPGGGGGLFANAYVFRSTFSNTGPVEVWAHSSFGSVANAQPYVQLLADAMGKLPEFAREELDHVVLHTGDGNFFAEEKGEGFFVGYSQRINTRVSNHDLEESVFHESMHVALETDHATSPGWIQAQQNDSGFITEYAEENPTKEDLSESALFAYAVVNHPGRLPAQVETAVWNLIPNRIEYLRQIPGFELDPGIDGDFDGDDDVDGHDFLAWQRGEAPGGMATASLLLWRNSFEPGSSVAATVAVPEPRAGLLALVCCLALTTVGKRRLSSGCA
jgi:hypothetical protein